jgi:hypothetical protein
LTQETIGCNPSVSVVVATAKKGLIHVVIDTYIFFFIYKKTYILYIKENEKKYMQTFSLSSQQSHLRKQTEPWETNHKKNEKYEKYEKMNYLLFWQANNKA